MLTFKFPEESTNRINDILYIEEGVFALALNNKVIISKGRSSNEDIEGIFNPISITYSKSMRKIFVLQDNGEIKEADPFDLNCPAESILEEETSKLIKNYCERGEKLKIPSKFSMSVNHLGHIYVSIASENSCFQIKGKNLESRYGNGKPGYSTSSNWNLCRFNQPGGVRCDKSNIYISDSGNSCIRKIEGSNISVIAGFPGKEGDEEGKKTEARLNRPEKITVMNKMGFFKDTQRIKYISFSKDNYVGSVYQSKNDLISFDVDESRNLFILEEVDG
jgi:hypothetical protein